MYCKQQIPIVNGLARQYRGDVYVQQVDIDDPGNRQLVSTYYVSATPTIVILNDSGEVSARFVGLTSGTTLQQAIEKALSEAVGGKTSA
ncbi:MAG: thioredoxin family protein [Anaerolineae bacterium]